MKTLSLRSGLQCMLLTLSLIALPGWAAAPEEPARLSEQQVARELASIQLAIRQSGAQWQARATPVANWTPEAKKRLTGLKPGGNKTPFINPKYQQRKPGLAALPASFDWRNLNGHSYVTSVKNQGNCGSCWAFAVTAALESRALISANTPDKNLDLSEQIVLSCSGAGDCGGGWPDQASNFLKSPGNASEAYYPYTADNGSCSTARPGWQSQSYKINSWQYVVQNATATVDVLKNALYATGPLVVTFRVFNDFYYYAGGVYQHVSGDWVGDHAVLLVGWNDADQAFIVKNSWGESWGTAGFFEIAYSELASDVQFGTEMVLADGAVTPPDSPCQFKLARNSGTMSAVGGSSSVSVNSSKTCAWSASSDASWLQITAGSSGAGHGTVRYLVGANRSTDSRTAHLTIGDQSFTLTQSGNKAGVPICSLSADPAFVGRGSPSHLSASCQPAASSYRWSANTGLSNTDSSGDVTPQNDTTYSVIGSNAAGSGNSATVTVTVGEPVPVKPTGLLAPSGNSSEIKPTYRWQPVPGATRYYLNLRENNGPTLYTGQFSPDQLGCASGTCSVTPDAALRNGGDYIWVLLAANHSGSSPWSEPQSFSVILNRP
ncbi:C1 family peptidase [Paludibacterium sp. B53371]|uniref:C1 family peptidase n=1 Tax=Paludibacterium sp. B53371 TaxID=2806263 RepID=UPI001C05446E|nr:C1 family peptidase [Paludibacterium sp. B53371]